MRALHVCILCCLTALAHCQQDVFHHEHEDHNHNYAHNNHQKPGNTEKMNKTKNSTSVARNITIDDDFTQTLLSNLNNRFASMRGCRHSVQHTAIADCEVRHVLV